MGLLNEIHSSPEASRVPADVVYPPNLQLLASGPSRPSQVVNPAYRMAPAPMGLADYGLGPGNSTYSVSASDVLGTIQLNSYNSTAGPLYEDTGTYYWDYESPYGNSTPWQSAIQLNTVVTNVSYPGANNGSFWTQNVLEFQGSEIQLVDNLWNLSNPYESIWPGTLYSYDGFLAYPEFYYAYGPTLPAAYPMTIDLYNNASVVDDRSTVTFGYRVTEPGHVYTGVYDQVVFNSTPNASVPLLAPDYLVSGTNLTPSGLLYDAELVFGGPGSGSNAVITSLNGSEAIEYNTSSGWIPAPSAYDYGSDTAETSVGFAGWYGGSTEQVNQGPSMLYGLWNTSGGVPSGNIRVDLDLDPSYQFVFIGMNGTDVYNESYAPSTAAGTVETALPPGVYNLSAWADGFDAGFGQFSSSLTGSSSLTPDPTVWDAPIYLNGRTQAEAFGTDATGWTGVGPVRVANLTVNVSLIFNHMNEYGYIEFALFWAYGFASPQLYVRNVTQGTDLNGQSLYIANEPGQVLNVPELGDLFEAWDVQAPAFRNLTLPGVDLTGTEEGGAVAVWDAPDASASYVNSTDSSFGFWAANSPDVVDTDSNSTSAGFALTLMASPHAQGSNLGSTLLGNTVLSEGADNASFDNVQALFYSVGYQGFASNNTRLSTVVVDVGSTGLDLQSDWDDQVANVSAGSGSLGVFGSDTISLTVAGMNVTTASGSILSWGARFYAGNWTNLTDLSVNDSAGVEFLGGNNESVTDADFINNSIGAFFIQTGPASVENLTANNSLGAFFEFNVGPVEASDVYAVAGGIAVASFLTQNVTCSGVVTSGGTGPGFTTYGVILDDADNSTVSGVVAENRSIGVNISASSETTVTNVSAYDGAAGVVADPASGVRVSGGYAFGAAAIVVADDSSGLVLNRLTAEDADGAVLQHSEAAWVTNTTVLDGGIGVLGQGVSEASVNATVAQNGSLGVAFDESADVWVNGTTATNGSLGVALRFSNDAWVLGVDASGSAPTSPYLDPAFGVPTAAVVTQETDRVVVSDVSVSGYPAGLYDNGSEDLIASAINVSNGDLGVILNETHGGLLDDLRIVGDQVGLQLNHDAELNVVSESAFVNNVGFGVDVESGSSNRFYDNTFSGNNGATSSYSDLHVQAFSASPSNWFNTTSGIGNYWADWHSYADGVLAPYFVGTGAWDYYPLGAPEDETVVAFEETGLLPLGTSWSVTLGGSTESSTTPTISFAEPPGTYAFSIASAPGWEITPETGTLTVASSGIVVPVAYAAADTVTFSSSGLPAGTSWSVVFNGVEHASTGTSLTFVSVGGSYAFAVLAPNGYVASPSNGTLVVGGDYLQPVSFRLTNPPPQMVTVDIEETGLPAGTTWTAYVGGMPVSGSTPTLSLEVSANATYSYQATSADTAYATASGAFSVLGSAYVLVLEFHQVLFPVTFTESGLADGTSWSVVVDGNTYSSSGPTVTVELSNGTFTYAYDPVGGYVLPATGASGTGAVSGAPAGLAVTYSAASGGPAYVSQSTFTTDLGLAFGLAALAVVVAVVALLRPPKGRGRSPPASAAEAATEDGSSTGTEEARRQ